MREDEGGERLGDAFCDRFDDVYESEGEVKGGKDDEQPLDREGEVAQDIAGSMLRSSTGREGWVRREGLMNRLIVR